MRIFVGFRIEGPQTTGRGSEPAIFSNFGRRIFGTFRAEANIICGFFKVPYRLTSDRKMLDLEWPWDAILRKICFRLFFCLHFELDDYVQQMKILPYCQRQKCSPGTLVSGSISFIRIFLTIFARGSVSWQCVRPLPRRFAKNPSHDR